MATGSNITNNENDAAVAAGSNGQTVSAYIPDGYTREFFIREHPEFLYPAIRGTYRPMLIKKQAGIMRQLREAVEDPDRQQHIAAHWITKHVVQWDLKKQTGQPIDAHDVDEVLRIAPAAFIRLWGLVLGDRGSDADPQGMRFDTSEHLAAERVPSLADRELADAKN